MSAREEEWLWGWDPTPGIVSVWAEPQGRAYVWRRLSGGELVREQQRFTPWVLVASLEDLRALGVELRQADEPLHARELVYRELEGPGALRYLLRARDFHTLRGALLSAENRRLPPGEAVQQLRELGPTRVLALPPEEQYLVASGRNYFRDLSFEQLQRLQFDLETSGLDAAADRIFLIALRAPNGDTELLEAESDADSAERELLQRFASRVQALDPDVIENHNLHGFDMPFLIARARRHGLSLQLGRLEHVAVQRRPAARGASFETSAGERPELTRRLRYTLAGRELIDSMDAVRRYDFSARSLPGHGLKAVARHFGLAHEQREYISGAAVARTYASDPERVRRYALDDVLEAEGVARVLGGTAFALARMVPRRYERLADAGAATGVLDPLLVRAYFRAGRALPAHRSGDGTVHAGASLHLFAAGVARRVVKADVASLYPSLMRVYRIGPARDELGAFLGMVERLTDLRLAAKAEARRLPAGSSSQHTQEALSAAMKIVINSAYGYLGAVQLTRFADVHAANEVTRRGRELLALICLELSRRGVTLLEADTDGVYFSVPDHFTEADERRVVSEVAAQLPARVQLELEGRYAAMLSHEPKNYALLSYDGKLSLRGVAFRSSRSEPFGSTFLQSALAALLRGDVEGVRKAYVTMHRALRRRALSTYDVTSGVRLTKAPAEYLSTRARRRELSYEAMLQNGLTAWRLGARVRVYRASSGRAGLWREDSEDVRDYDGEYYARLLHDTFAARLSRGLSEEAFAAVCADPEQLELFAPSLAEARPTLTVLSIAQPAPALADTVL